MESTGADSSPSPMPEIRCIAAPINTTTATRTMSDMPVDYSSYMSAWRIAAAVTAQLELRMELW